MLNNDGLNVFIGLVFIFSVYSILATLLMESFARKFGLRARMLLKAISNILDDADFQKSNSLRRSLVSMGESKYFRPFENRNFTALFYSHPNIVNLGKNSFSSKPSYLSAEMFVETLIQILRGDKFSGSENQIDLIKQNLQLGGNHEGELALPQFYQIEKKSSKPYLLAEPAKSSNADSIPHIQISGQTLYQIKQHIFDSHQDIDSLKSKLSRWYRETMERAEGWYIRQTRSFLFIIGFFVALIFNVDCIAISKKLSRDKELGNKIIELAGNFNTPVSDSSKASFDKAFNGALREANNLQNVLSAGEREWASIFGWLLTAIAISLGASFWFDLLKRVMAIRAAGTKPTGKTPVNTHEREEAIG